LDLGVLDKDLGGGLDHVAGDDRVIVVGVDADEQVRLDGLTVILDKSSSGVMSNCTRLMTLVAICRDWMVRAKFRIKPLTTCCMPQSGRAGMTFR